MSSFETWEFRSTFDNSWISETFLSDNEALIHALTHVSDFKHVSLPKTETETPSSSLPTIHSVSTSDPETPPVSKRLPQNPTKKITKRKTRVSKRSTTTFITADPENFRQMVQQVTGVQFGSESGPVRKPEPYRSGFGPGVGCMPMPLPTLDTSAFLLDQRQQDIGPASVITSGPRVGAGNRPGSDFDGFNCFPTLESWKVM